MGLFSAIGGLLGSGLSFLQGKSQEDMQKDFAKKGIQWRVEDAKKAGIHPLAALGANTMSYSPVSVGDLSSSFANMGQDIERSVAAGGTTGQRARQMEALTLEHASLENDLLRAQIGQINRPHVGPAMPAVAGTGTDEGVNVVPPQRTPLVKFGVPWDTNPAVTDAQTIEDRYGDSELLSMMSALGIGGMDAYYNFKRWANSRRGPAKRYAPTRSGYKARYLKGY